MTLEEKTFGRSEFFLSSKISKVYKFRLKNLVQALTHSNWVQALMQVTELLPMKEAHILK